MSIKKIFTFLVTFIISLSCKSNREDFTYYDDGKLKQVKIYFSRKDTSHYKYELFYPTGIVKEEGVILNSKKDGIWKTYYKDGMPNRVILYKEGEADYLEKEPPIVHLIPPTVKVGQKAKVRLPNLHPDYFIMYNDVTVVASPDEDEDEDEDDYDFEVRANSTDSIYIDYFDLGTYTLITLDLAKTTDSELAKYGKKRENIELDPDRTDSIITFPVFHTFKQLIAVPVEK